MTTYLYTSSGPYSCQACNMGFSNTALLAKHKARFCIGDAGDMVLIRQCRRCREHKCSCEEVPEYERMREAEKREYQDVVRPRRRQSNRSDESMSIHLIRDRSKYNPNNDPKLQSLAANHGKQMEFLSNRNKDLERQRDEIRRRLGALGKKPADTDNTSALLAELRDQEARNQRLLDELKKQLLASRQPVALIGEQQHVQQKKTYTYPVYYGNSLVAEISAIRQAYIQSGGNDPEILAQLAQMLAEAQAIEEAMRNKKPAEPKKKEKKTTEITSHVMTMDMENERLNRELLLLQEQNLMARNRRKDDREVPPVTVINYPSPVLPSPREAKDEIILISGNNNNNDMDGSGDCQICSAYFTHIPFDSGNDSSQYPQMPYNYSQYYPQQYPQQYPQYYPQQQPQQAVQAPTSEEQKARATTVAPPTVAASVEHHNHSHGHSHTLNVPPMSSRAPTAATIIPNDSASVVHSAREHKSHRSHKSHKSHKSHR